MGEIEKEMRSAQYPCLHHDSEAGYPYADRILVDRGCSIILDQLICIVLKINHLDAVRFTLI